MQRNQNVKFRNTKGYPNIPITIDPSMDLTFKNLFGMKESKSILIDFQNKNSKKRNYKDKIIRNKIFKC